MKIDLLLLNLSNPA